MSDAPPSAASALDELTVARLGDIMPRCKPQRAAELLPHLKAACRHWEVTTAPRLCAFLAQLAVESGELQHFEELASGYAYEGRWDLGNVRPGDGVRYKGRGPIQLTGRRNYLRAGGAMGLALEKHPEMAAQPDVGFRVAGWYWHDKGCNELADLGRFDAITKRVNGGMGHADRRRAYFAAARHAFGLDPLST